jgi:Dolichyl-phosphate-mannose-protein mannosyltransferase
MSPRLAAPILLALPFLAGVAVLKGLTVEVDTFHGTDARLYHLPTILHLAESLDLERYPAAQTPLFHLLFAGWGKLVGFELWRLRVLEVIVSYLAVLVLFRLLARRGLAVAPACALALVFALSPYYLGPSFALLTDNLAILFGVVALDRLDRFEERRGAMGDLALACLATALAVLTRQSLAWLALVAAVFLVRAPWPARRKAAGAALIVLALAPFAALVVAWGDLVPPGSDPASCGVCGEDAGLGLRPASFTIAIAGLYAAALFGPQVLRNLRPGMRDLPPGMLFRSTRRRDLTRGAIGRARRRAPSPLALALPAMAGAALLLVSPLAYDPGEPGRPGDAGYLWQLSDRLPELLGTSLLFWVLVPLGAVALGLLASRTGIAALPVVYLGAFLLASLPVGLVYQKYFDPFALLALALFALPGDLRERVDYAGAAALCLAFVAYAFSFAG